MDNPEKFIVTAGGRIKCLRCTAMSKNSQQQCAKPALNTSKTQKCGHHGGRGSGPKTAEGKARIGASHLVHGRETNQRRLERSESSLLLAHLEDAMHAVGMTAAARTTGRKPSGYRAIRTLDDAKRWAVEDALRQIEALPDGE